LDQQVQWYSMLTTSPPSLLLKGQSNNGQNTLTSNTISSETKFRMDHSLSSTVHRSPTLPTSLQNHYQHQHLIHMYKIWDSLCNEGVCQIPLLQGSPAGVQNCPKSSNLRISLEVTLSMTSSYTG
jgi:hypothetical protein